MNANSRENFPSALPTEESVTPTQINWGDEAGEYAARVLIVGFGIFVGWIAAYIIGVFVGWIPFSIC